MSERVRIFDTTLRDGEQSAGVCFQPEDKVEIASLLAEMGVDVIEAGFPASSAGERRAVAQVARSVRGTVICGLARAVLDDVEAAAEALADAEAPRIHVFVNASDMQIDRQLRKSRRDVVGMVDAAVRRARRATDDVEFSPMDATRADPEFLAEVVRTALAAGATTINIPDTVGYILPVKLEQLFRDLRRRVPEVEGAVLSFHGQDDLGLATANAVAAVRAGARQIEVAVNGIGERAGNTAFEEVVMALRIHGETLGVHTGVDPEGIYRVSRCVEDRSGMPVPPNKPIVGRNAFRHASGIHQDGVLKWRETYELIDPKTIGHPTGTEIVLGKLSGRAGFAERARQLGFALDEAGLDHAFVRFQSVAETQRAVGDEEVMAICRGAAA